ncbi:MAG: apolipoprotein N-acyltransferase [Planctomycetia bacterium]
MKSHAGGFEDSIGRWKPSASTGRLFPSGGLAFGNVQMLVKILAAAVIAALVAAPWLRQDLVACEWLGVALALTCVPRVRGWIGEGLALAAATAAIATAFHWSPKVLAYAMNTSDGIGYAIAAPIMLWDGIRLSLPFWCAARLTRDPLATWLPAGLVAVVAEWLLPSVFPWKLGYSQIAWSPFVQAADLLGPEITTFTLFALAGVIVWMLHAVGTAIAARSLAAPVRLPPAALLAVMITGANVLYGWFSIAAWERAATASPQVRLALVQANPEDAGGLDGLRALTKRGWDTPGHGLDLVCWPECSAGSYEDTLTSLTDPDEVLKRSRDPQRGMRPLDRYECPLLCGGKVFTGYPERPTALHQSALLIDADHAITGRYHKRHLMPFGEYVPGEDWFPDVKRYFPMQDDLTAGREATVLEAGSGARLGVMLCYEDMIPEAARSIVAEGATVLVSLINGAAFTEPLTLAQHRLLAQLRAVENRRSFVRCAATGETCVISPVGRIVARLPVHVQDSLVAVVPLVESRTLYSRTGDVFPLFCAAGIVIMAYRRRASTEAIATC